MNKLERLKKLMAQCAPIPWPVDGHEHAHIAEIINALPDLIAAVKALHDLKQEIDNLSGIELTRDIEPYKAQAVWDDVNDRASAALKPFEED